MGDQIHSGSDTISPVFQPLETGSFFISLFWLPRKYQESSPLLSWRHRLTPLARLWHVLEPHPFLVVAACFRVLFDRYRGETHRFKAERAMKPNNALNLAHFVRWTVKSCAFACPLA